MGKYDRLTDEQLIERLRAGEREIMDHLMVKYKSMVRKKARAMYLLGGENEDLIQEGMIGLNTRSSVCATMIRRRALHFPVSLSCACPGRCTAQ